MVMIKVIRPQLQYNQTQCKHCDTILEYELEDIFYNKEEINDFGIFRYAYIGHIICPICQNTIYAGEREDNDSGNFISW